MIHDLIRIGTETRVQDEFHDLPRFGMCESRSRSVIAWKGSAPNVGPALGPVSACAAPSFSALCHLDGRRPTIDLDLGIPLPMNKYASLAHLATHARHSVSMAVYLGGLMSLGYGHLAAGTLYVNGSRGNDLAAGTESAPLGTLQAAVKRLPAQIQEDQTIVLAEGSYARSAGEPATLELNRPMREGAMVRIVGQGGPVVLNWRAPEQAMISVTQGRWWLERLQIGSRLPDQHGGLRVTGPALVELHSVRIRTAHREVPGLRVTRGGMVHLYGQIELNEDLDEDRGRGESFCGIVAEYGGVVRFEHRENASLSIGNGSLSAKYYGVIELGCASARITSWHDQANVIAVNNSGRIDFHSTRAVLTARDPCNTPIGLEDDGHVLAEGAPITIAGCTNGNAIVLQKASSFFCNEVTLQGSFRSALACMSGSTLLVGIIGDLNEGEVTTGGRIILEKCTGRLTRPIETRHQGVLIRPAGS